MNRNNPSAKVEIWLPPFDIMVAEWDFEAGAADELTIKEGDELLILSDGPDWVPAQHVYGPEVDRDKVPSGLVPRTYLKSSTPICRGSARYDYKAENETCVNMRVGQKLDIYTTGGKWALVKVEASGGKPGGVGYVQGNYIEYFDDSGMELLCPSTEREQPQDYCYLCEGSIRHVSHFECTQCRLPNGDAFYVCRECAYRREALSVHQTIKGENHLFSRGKTKGCQCLCNQCYQPIDGLASFTCLTCPKQIYDSFDLCTRCYNDPTFPRHRHHMSPVSAEGKFLESEVSTIPTILPIGPAHVCAGCRRDIPRYFVDCKTCLNSGFTLCPECAELDRATFLHDRWTGGGPHEFRIVERYSQSPRPPRRQIP